ncbi:hypothetical protein PG999_010501 [Apiospora kogelbergensis]|uniref:Fumarylacetoacetase-like C-terminal domain-containing protein n=1 Tax=Apiospora kogelbergensis TaxID=1337665 RepID=A0AAW0QBW0_9PEZI
MSIPSFTRLIRFVPKSDASKICIGEPESGSIDVGRALRQHEEVAAILWSGTSVLAPGVKTEQRELVDRVLSPVASTQVGTIRCIGLNRRGLTRPCHSKPSDSLGDPWPAPVVLPAITKADGTGDYEAELAVVIGKACKNVTEAEAMDYVLGYTACNDVSSRASQFAQSQWCFSKGFDGSCPIGPTLVSKSLIPDPSKLRIRGLKNGDVMQDCQTDDLIFSIGKIVSFLSQGTTLPAGTVIITGTPAGVGTGRNPEVNLEGGDDFAVEILPHIGTLVNVFEYEK